MSTLLEQASLVLIPSGYKEDVVYSQIPTSGAGDLSFTRASNGTRVNSAGLVEVCPWNLLQQSETLSVSPWGRSSLTFNSTVTAPNGTTTALNYSTAGAFAYALQTITVASGEYYTSSCYLKYTSGVGSIAIRYTDSASVNFISVTANLINGTIGSVSYGGNGANGTATITSVGDGWYRVTVSGTLIISNAGFIVSNLTLGATTFSIWGAQLNIGSTAKPYFPTTDRLNVPRLTYQNGGGGCPSLLLEPQRTNLVLYSEQFDNAAWTQSMTSTTANQTTSPDGNTNADLINALTGTGQHFISAASINFTSGVAYTMSVFAKKGNTPLIQLFGASGIYGSNVWATYNFDTLEVTTGSAATASMVDYENGWYRLILTGTSISTSLTYAFYAAFTNDKSVRLPSFTAANQTFYLWGAQTEQGAYPTTYIPTTSSSATRVADACFKTGISSLIGQTSGTLFVDSILTHNATSNEYLIQVSASATNRFFIYREATTNKLGCFSIVGGATIYTQLTAAAITGRVKAAFAYSSGSFAFYVNGVQVGTSAATFGTPASMGIFNIDSNDGLENGFYNYNEAILFKTRLTNAELASLTTI
jgi:hypothetical protein